MKLFHVFALSLAVVAVALTGCAKDPSKSVPAAKVEEPNKEEPKAEEPKKEEPKAEPAAVSPTNAPAAASPTAAPAAAGAALTFPGVALTKGSIHAVGSKVTGSHELNFKEWKGSFEAKDGKAEGGKLEFEVRMASLEEVPHGDYSEKLEGHLKSGDFFDVEKFATATFQSTGITAGGDAAMSGSTHMVKGNLTLHGATKEVSFPAIITMTGKEVAAKTEFSINRKDFGIVYPGKAEDLIRDGVVIKVDLQATLP